MECSANDFLLKIAGDQCVFSAIFKQGHSLLQVLGNQLPRRFAVRHEILLHKRPMRLLLSIKIK